MPANAPMCAMAGKDDRCAVVARDVDHIKPHGGSKSVFFDKDNLQSLCKPCHSRKTAQELHQGRKHGFDEHGMPLDPDHHWNRED